MRHVRLDVEVAARCRLRVAVNSWLLITLDSCRYDTFVEAAPRFPSALLCNVGESRHDTIALPVRTKRAHVCATWTGPAHYSLLSGLLPHADLVPSAVAPDLYRDGLAGHVRALGLPVAALATFAPALWLPSWLGGLGYATAASVSMPVLNAGTAINRSWHAYRVAGAFNDFGDHADWLSNYVTRKRRHATPWFAMINAGETHYPYLPHGRKDDDDPHLSGLHGVARGLRDGIGARSSDQSTGASISSRFPVWRARQVQRVRELDEHLCALIPRLPSGTRVTVTADHGEAFGEDGWFGHGPVPHPIVLEVPLVDGVVP